jgi:hypothetical protein
MGSERTAPRGGQQTFSSSRLFICQPNFSTYSNISNVAKYMYVDVSFVLLFDMCVNFICLFTIDKDFQ